MPKTTIYYYHPVNGKNVIREFILSLQIRQQAKVRRMLQLISEYGLSAVIPHIKKLSGTPLWEIRLLGSDNIRLFYAVKTRTSVVILHGFAKKSQKTPIKEVKQALSRYQDWLSRN
jgi:phage-related protein